MTATERGYITQFQIDWDEETVFPVFRISIPKMKFTDGYNEVYIASESSLVVTWALTCGVIELGGISTDSCNFGNWSKFSGKKVSISCKVGQEEESCTFKDFFNIEEEKDVSGPLVVCSDMSINNHVVYSKLRHHNPQVITATDEREVLACLEYMKLFKYKDYEVDFSHFDNSNKPLVICRDSEGNTLKIFSPAKYWAFNILRTLSHAIPGSIVIVRDDTGLKGMEIKKAKKYRRGLREIFKRYCEKNNLQIIYIKNWPDHS